MSWIVFIELSDVKYNSETVPRGNRGNRKELKIIENSFINT